MSLYSTMWPRYVRCGVNESIQDESRTTLLSFMDCHRGVMCFERARGCAAAVLLLGHQGSQNRTTKSELVPDVAMREMISRWALASSAIGEKWQQIENPIWW